MPRHSKTNDLKIMPTMKSLILILFTLLLVSCNRSPLTLAQTRSIEQLYRGSAVGSFRIGGKGPIAVARKADGSVWIFVFETENATAPYYEEEVIPSPMEPFSPKTSSP